MQGPFYSVDDTKQDVASIVVLLADVLMVAHMLQCYVCRLSARNVLCLNGASQSKSYYLQLVGSRIWEIDWYQNE